MEISFDSKNIPMDLLLSGKLAVGILSQDHSKVVVVLPTFNAFRKFLPVFNSSSLSMESFDDPHYDKTRAHKFYEKFRDRISWGIYDKTDTFVLLHKGDKLFIEHDGNVTITY